MIAPRPRSTPSPTCKDPGAALAQLAADDRALDFGRAFPDSIDAHLAVQPFDGVLAHIAAAAENLNRLVEHPAGHFGGLQLQRARPRMSQLAVEAVIDLP